MMVFYEILILDKPFGFPYKRTVWRRLGDIPALRCGGAV
jgi:hypothetical protein